jgi:hypothetical protein
LGPTLRYQWYSNTTASNIGGIKIDGATSSTFAIPTTLAAGTYYYYCEVSIAPIYEAEAVFSTVAQVNAVTVDGVSIRDNEKTSEPAMWFVQNPASEIAEIRVAEGVITRVVIYDALGNMVFDSPEPTWNLTNTAGRFVANGAYLVVVEVKLRDGKIQMHSGKLGVRR